MDHWSVRVGRVKGQFIANPTHSQMKKADLDLVYVGNATDHCDVRRRARRFPSPISTRRSPSAMNVVSPLSPRKRNAARAGKKNEKSRSHCAEEILLQAKAL